MRILIHIILNIQHYRGTIIKGGELMMDYDKTLEQIGVNVSFCREEKGLTQSELAERAGIGFEYLCWLEKGAKPFSFDTVYEIAEVLGVEAMELLRKRD